MENILLLLALFAVLKSIFMTSLLPNRWYRFAFSISPGVFVILSYPYAIEQNKLQMQEFLSTQSAVMNISLVVMADTLLSLYFCFARMRKWEPGKRFKWHITLLRHIPSLLVFPALYYIHVNLFFSFPGINFLRTGIILASGVSVVFVLASFFIRKLLHEKELLIETVLMLTLFLFILVICCTVFHPSATVYGYSPPIDWAGCITTLGVLAVLLISGYLFSYTKKHFKRLR